ncbi:hypothetical protein [Solicola gregarius]|uniref:Uncharacterized protein n=1 Tax=Solicola gregarius TaxID=2908642 RepID=A0AA46TLY3_9ACTN|nr:hypothetical protein [Solicola gregarius]UYM06848.1 hypothetical protein L0C25_07165 [Solicola gregarius]
MTAYESDCWPGTVVRCISSLVSAHRASTSHGVSGAVPRAETSIQPRPGVAASHEATIERASTPRSIGSLVQVRRS